MEPKRKERIESDLPVQEVEELEAVLEDIADDARKRAARYLKETVVPEGGE